MDYYFEAAVIGTPRFPTDVHFIIGSFPDLFGTGVGLAVQQWCIQHGWLLVWALGKNGDAGKPARSGVKTNRNSARLRPVKFWGNDRIVDPVVAAHGVRTTLSPQVIADFTPVRYTQESQYVIRSRTRVDVQQLLPMVVQSYTRQTVDHVLLLKHCYCHTIVLQHQTCL